MPITTLSIPEGSRAVGVKESGAGFLERSTT
jgi:hypothetical protein